MILRDFVSFSSVSASGRPVIYSVGGGMDLAGNMVPHEPRFD
jgi:hypothetical protein